MDPVVLEQAVDPVIQERAVDQYKCPFFKQKTAIKRAAARKPKMVLVHAKAARRQQQIVDDIGVCDTILKRVKAELALQMIRRVKRVQKEADKSKSESESFMYSCTRFYGGGPFQSSDLESEEEGNKTAESKEAE